MRPVIQVEHLSKVYQLGQIGTGTISRDLERFWATKIRGKEDPFLRIGERNDRTLKGESDVVFSLRDINMEIRQGDTVGIIGKNGAGKSTLLKILSRVTTPSAGCIKIKGRVASLLEVGTGFHPELTGKENIFLNGAIMGMKKKEIQSRLDEIIAFSGVERYIDTPVKRYSSGMYVRLAFAVAAHLASEILIVDEVLAVGDAEFQKKCLGKMKDVSTGEGRTVLFVSHNMQAINTLCERTILLEKGGVRFDGHTKSGMEIYLSSLTGLLDQEELENTLRALGEDADFELTGLSFRQEGTDGFEFLSDQPVYIQFDYQIKKKVTGLRVGFDIIDKSTEAILFRTYHDDNEQVIDALEPGFYRSTITLHADFLKAGAYLVDILVGIHNVRWIIHNEVFVQININNFQGINNAYADERPGILMPRMHWENTFIPQS